MFSITVDVRRVLNKTEFWAKLNTMSATFMTGHNNYIEVRAPFDRKKIQEKKKLMEEQMLRV